MTAETGLRARKKDQTRRAIHRAALELADATGGLTSTAEDIAERAQVSVRTFFNYYPTKDDALAGFDPELPDRARQAVLDCDPNLSTIDVIREVFTTRVTKLRDDTDLWALRRQVAACCPEIGARMVGAMTQVDRAIVDAAVERAGATGADELAVAVDAHKAVGAFRAAVRQHAVDDYTGNLLDYLDRAFSYL